MGHALVTPEGNRLIDLGFGDIKTLTLAFIGLSKEKSKRMLSCYKKYGSKWVYYWLKENDFNEWADYWESNYFNEEKI